MGCARHIGRVGALAVTLGVGVAIAWTPGIAYADPSAGDSLSSSESSSSATRSSASSSPTKKTKKSSADADATSAKGPRTDTAASDSEPRSANESTVDGDDPADDDAVDAATADDAKTADAAESAASQPVADDEDTAPADTAQHDRSVQTATNGDSARHRAASRSGSVPRSTRLATTDADSTVTVADEVKPQPQTVSLAVEQAAPAPQPFVRSSTQAHPTSVTTLTSAVPAPAVPQQPKTLVSAVSDFVAAVLHPLLSPAQGTPIQIPILTAALSLVRNEFERIFAPRKANVASQQDVSLLADLPTQVDPTQQHVLLIGVDGTNLSRILADDYNQNFFDLMDDSTTAAASIVGHTTISNPSWTAILTGVWGSEPV